MTFLILSGSSFLSDDSVVADSFVGSVVVSGGVPSEAVPESSADSADSPFPSFNLIHTPPVPYL